MPSLGIANLHQSNVGQLFGTPVVHLDGYDVVLPIGYLEHVLEVGPHIEVAQNECRAGAFYHTCEEFQGSIYVGSLAFGLEVEHLAYDIENVFPSLFGCDVLLYAVGEEYYAYLVVVLYGRESEGCSYLGCHVPFCTLYCPEVQRAANVDEEHHSEFPFFFEHFHERSVEACRNVPVNVADVVSVLVFAHL